MTKLSNTSIAIGGDTFASWVNKTNLLTDRVNNAALEAYKIKKQKQNNILSDINSIKEELGELREMLKLVISSQKGN